MTKAGLPPRDLLAFHDMTVSDVTQSGSFDLGFV